MHHNEVDDIPADAFDGFPSLIELCVDGHVCLGCHACFSDLRYNRFTSASTRWLQNLPMLENLFVTLWAASINDHFSSQLDRGMPANFPSRRPVHAHATADPDVSCLALMYQTVFTSRHNSHPDVSPVSHIATARLGSIPWASCRLISS